MLFFSEEKNQKTFISWRCVRKSGTWPESLSPLHQLFAGVAALSILDRAVNKG
jgi:hypothetical protein